MSLSSFLHLFIHSGNVVVDDVGCFGGLCGCLDDGGVAGLCGCLGDDAGLPEGLADGFATGLAEGLPPGSFGVFVLGVFGGDPFGPLHTYMWHLAHLSVPHPELRLKHLPWDAPVYHSTAMQL